MEILENVSLKEFSNMKIGGPAKYFLRAKSSDDIISGIRWAREKKERFYILGAGAKTVFSDLGFDGLVIKQENREFHFEGNFLIAKSGAIIQELIDESLERNLLGLEEFSGIPSTVGGAAFINLHYYQSLFGDLVESGKIFDVFEDKTIDCKKDWFEYGYEASKLQTKISCKEFFSGKENTEENNENQFIQRYILLECNLKLQKVDDKEKWIAFGKSKEIIRSRNYKYPLEPSVGSIFQNLTNEEKSFYGAPTVSAAYYIDKLGLKGLKVGGIEISGRHANIFINPEGNGTCSDLLKLIDIVKAKVKENFGIELKNEINIIQ